jgi:hypothetical protein
LVKHLFSIFRQPHREIIFGQGRAEEILNILLENFSLPEGVNGSRDTFRILILTVFSQAIAGRNPVRAFRTL